MHCTRHTYITWAIGSDTPLKIVSQRVGCSIRVLEETYAHVVGDSASVEWLDQPGQTGAANQKERRK